MAKPELYFSTDVETDGPIPGPHSMLSLGTAVFAADGELLGTFERNLDLLPGAQPHPDTERFWSDNPEAYAATRVDTRPPEVAMREYVEWVESFKTGSPVFVAYPAGFDFTFVYWYMIRFAGRSPFSFSALDMKSYAMAKLGTPYRQSTKRNMPKAWFSDKPHTHKALDDAIEQGELWIAMLKHQAKGLASRPSGFSAGA
jgi:hypothetical protein